MRSEGSQPVCRGHADDVRREVLRTLVAGAFLPPSRRQILEIIECIDTLANAFEAALDYLIGERVEVREDFKPRFLEILGTTEDILDKVEFAIRALFFKRAK